MTDDQIKHMVDKFLAYRFPEDIQPDGGLSIRRVFNEGTPHEFRATPSGTNLLNAAQATDMVRHMIEGLPALPPHGDGLASPRPPEFYHTLDLAYRAVDALGGTGASDAYNSALDATLAAIETLGGMDAWQRKQKGYPNASA